MFEDQSSESLVRKILPRVAKAAIKGILYFFLFYVVPMFFVSRVSGLAPDLFGDYQQLVTVFAAITIFFAVATELTSGTIYQHALSIGRALVLVIYFVLALDGGVVRLNLDIIEGQAISIVADLRTYLVMLISIDFLTLARSVLQMVSYLSERTEREISRPLPHENL